MEICMLSRKPTRTHSAGITLIELMIAVGIVGILAAIAYPSYQAQMRRGNRTDAKAELMKAAQELEKCFTRFGAYDNAACNSYNGILGGARVSEGGRYGITFTAGSVTPTTYILRATVRAGQLADPECGTLTLDQSGRRDRTGNAPMDRCW
jgi:type IV pilus assembly protein PilE